MDYYEKLLDVALKLGYRLAMSGAETFRVEESITRVLSTYNIQSETFAIPNCLTVSILTEEGKPLTRMCRIGFHGNDLDSVERYSNLSRRICSEKPTPQEAVALLNEADAQKKVYKLPGYLIGNFLGAFGFGLFFGGSFRDGICAGICGIFVGLVNKGLNGLKVNQFFNSIACSFLLALTAYLMGFFHLADNSEPVTIGALMILMPGLIFTNAMRDIIFGDTNSGVNRIVQMVMIASAVALGSGVAYKVMNFILGPMISQPVPQNPYWLQCVAATIGCIGFSILFNIHGPGGLLCALGGFFSWAAYCIAIYLGSQEFFAYFFAAVIAGIYSEAMARIRKFPAISYLVVSIFPLIPGAGIYYSSSFIAHADLDMAVAKSMQTIGITGAIAVGILMVSTIVRHWYVLKGRIGVRRKKHS